MFFFMPTFISPQQAKKEYTYSALTDESDVPLTDESDIDLDSKDAAND